MEEPRKIMALMESMTDAFRDRDLDKIMSCYQEGAIVIYEPGKELSHQGQIRGWYEGVFLINPSYHLSQAVVVVNDKIATFQALWAMEGKGRDGRLIQRTGKLLNVLSKNEAGDWKILIDNPHIG